MTVVTDVVDSVRGRHKKQKPRLPPIINQATGKIYVKELLFDSPQQLEDRVNAYFEECAKTGQKITKGNMLLYVGFRSFRTFDNYGIRHPEFAHVISWAQMRIIAHYESLLATNTPTGAIFMLKNLRDGFDEEAPVPELTPGRAFEDTQTLEHSGPGGGPIALKPLTDLTPDEAYMRMLNSGEALPERQALPQPTQTLENDDGLEES